MNINWSLLPNHYIENMYYELTNLVLFLLLLLLYIINIDLLEFYIDAIQWRAEANGTIWYERMDIGRCSYSYNLSVRH